MSVKKNLIRNGTASAFQKLVRIGEQIFLVPFFITYWGGAYYGEWLTLTIIPSIIAFSDLGVGSAAANTFVLRYVSDDKEGAANISKVAFYIISGIIVITIFISSIGLWGFSYFHWFDELIINKSDVIWAIILLMLAKLLGFYQQLYEAYYRAAHKANVSIYLISIYSLFNILTGIIVLICGGKVIAYSLFSLIISIVFYLFYVNKAISLLQNTNKGEIIKEDVKYIFNKGFGFLLSPVWQVIYFQGTTFVVRLVLGAEAVAIFNTLRTLSRSVNQGFNIINNSIFPEFQFQIAKKNLKGAKNIYKFSLIFTFILAVIGIIILYFFGPWLYSKWTKNEFNLPVTVWNIFIIGIFFNALWWTSAVIFRALNRPYQLSIIGVLSAIVSVIISYYLSKNMGLIGAAIGSIFLDIIMALYILPKSFKIINTLK